MLIWAKGDSLKDFRKFAPLHVSQFCDRVEFGPRRADIRSRLRPLDEQELANYTGTGDKEGERVSVKSFINFDKQN